MAGKAIKELRSTCQPERIVAAIMRSPLIVFIMFNIFVSITEASYARYDGNEATSNFHDQPRSSNVTVQHSSWPFSSNLSHRHRHHHNLRKSQQKQTQDIRKSLNSFKSYNKPSGKRLKYSQSNKNSLNTKYLPRQNETIKHHKTAQHYAQRQSNYVNHSSVKSYKESPNRISLKSLDEVAWTKNPSYTSNQLQQHNIRHQNHKQNQRMIEDAPRHNNYDSATTLATPINHQSHLNYVQNRNSLSSPWRPNVHPSYLRTVTTTTTTVKYEEDDDEEDEYFEKNEPNDQANTGSRINRGAEPILKTTTRTPESTTESLTDEKWRKYGTREGVTNERRSYSRGRHSPEILNEQKVSEHIARVNYEAKCKLPQRKLEYMKSTPNKSYKPRATVLYRCGNDTACCPSDTQTCVMKHQVQVTLVFQVNEIFKRPYYENATFYNHTECHCVAKSSAPERNPSPPAPMQVPICNCPRHFQSHFDEDNNCWCQCPPRQHSYEKGICEALTEGEGFSIEDRRCIRNKVCGMPRCVFGSYREDQGRCPSKHEKMNLY